MGFYEPDFRVFDDNLDDFRDLLLAAAQLDDPRLDALARILTFAHFINLT
jgi:hypothetical protein